MANKVYDYGLYTGKDLSLTYENFDTPEDLRNALEISATITFEGTKTFTGSKGYINNDFRIVIANLDSEYGLLKATKDNGTNVHPGEQSGNQIVLAFPAGFITEISLGEKTLHKVYNSYKGNRDLISNWDNVTLTLENFNANGLYEAWKEGGITANDITIENRGTFIGSGGQVSDGFTISINTKNDSTRRLQVINSSGGIISSQQRDHTSIITLNAGVIVSKVGLGHVENESYGPGGCQLETKLDSHSTSVRIDNNTEYNDLKRYSIPKFYTDNRSVSGYGWYRGAGHDEILNSTSGYQTANDISPFNTNKPRQMLFCPGQLRDPGFTVLYNGGEGDFMNTNDAQCTIHENQVSTTINNEIQQVYQLLPGDVVIQYQFTPTAQVSFVPSKESLGIGRDRQGNAINGKGEDAERDYYLKKTSEGGEEYPCMRPVPEIYSQTQEGDFGKPIKIIGVTNKDQEYEVQGNIDHNKEAVNILRIGGDERIRDDMNLYKVLLTYTDVSFGSSFITQSSEVECNEVLTTWVGKMDSGLLINGLITVKNVPILVNDNKTYNQNFAQQSVIMADFTLGTTLAGNAKYCNATGAVGLNSKLLPNRGKSASYFPLFESGVVSYHGNNDYLEGGNNNMYSACAPGFYNQHEYKSTTHSCYVVGHFQVPPDEITEGDAVSPTPF